MTIHFLDISFRQYADFVASGATMEDVVAHRPDDDEVKLTMIE